MGATCTCSSAALYRDGATEETSAPVPVLDLDYDEDSEAETDMNIVMNDAGRFIEVQGTAEGHAFTDDEFKAMLDLARNGIAQIVDAQIEAIDAAVS